MKRKQHVFQFYYDPGCKTGRVNFMFDDILDKPLQLKNTGKTKIEHKGNPEAMRLILNNIFDQESRREGASEPQEKDQDDVKGKTKVDEEDLRKPFKEILKCPFTRRIVEFLSPDHRMPANVKIYDGTGDPEDHVHTQTVDEMLKRVNDYLRPEEAFCSTELPRGSSNEETHRYSGYSEMTEASGFPMTTTVIGQNISLLLECRNTTSRDPSNKTPTTPTQPTPLVGVPIKENLNRFCDYDNEKGHNTNDCFHLKHQLEIALESGKPNHLIKDVMQRGKEGQRNNGPQKAKVINIVQSHPLDRKRKTTLTDEGWMNVPIIFPPILARDLSEEALVVEVDVEGYLVRRIYIDEGALVEIMFEHCFNMLHPSIRSRLVETQTTVSRFSREQVKPLRKIELDVCFGGSGRCQRAIMKFTVIPAPSPYNIILGPTVVSQTPVVLECKNERKKQAIELSENVRTQDDTTPTEQVLINPAYPKQLVIIGRGLSPEGSAQLKKLLKRNTDIFAWEPSDMTEVPKRIIKHSLNANPSVTPISQKRRVFCYEKSQMADEDKEKIAFYTDQGTYCYTKMPFGLKNATATYQHLVDEAFQSQIRKNLEVYVDDMVVKSKTERGMLADIAETFDYLRRINMKLNPKKCSFGVTEGKFLGYMVTSEGIRANSTKTKVIAEMQSPKTWGEMQTLAGKLAALNQKAESAFQELKKMVLDLSALTTPLPKETLFVYLAASQEAVSAVLLVIRKRRQHPVHYVSRKLHDAEQNYAPLEKMALALRHVSRRLRRYFKAHPITVITVQPIKQVLSKADTPGRLAPYSVELAAYNITYEPHSAIKGHILTDFINEVPVGSDAMVPWQTQYTTDHDKDRKEEWVLYTDGEASAKGFGAGLVLISPTKTGYTYALRLNFESTNTQAGYEALLAGLRIAKKI
nr:reverse transcriptase domain-containing protein [Tanacetum cinerariifolium]